MNVALLGKDLMWGGGIDLLRLIANALLLKSEDHPLTIHLLLPDENKYSNILDFLTSVKRNLSNQNYSLIKNKGADLLDLFQDYFKNLDGNLNIIKYYNSARGLKNCLKTIKADIAFPVATSLGKKFPVPWIGYFWDFQHKYYPNLFTSDECLRRDTLVATTLRDTKAMIVNSQTVKDDIDKFFPFHNSRIFNLPFAAAPILSWFEEPRENIQIKYNLPENYFLISNQFWVHKSHITAFQALAALENNRFHIVCTGNTHDDRFPNYFHELQEKIHQLGIKKRIHFLGHIPKLDQINIMKKALAVLQPTLFEGGRGGGAVYDAVALGVPAIVSDLSINMEIEGEDILFFKSGSFEDMADKMKMILNQNRIGTLKEVLIKRGTARTQKLNEKLFEVIEYTINH